MLQTLTTMTYRPPNAPPNTLSSDYSDTTWRVGNEEWIFHSCKGKCFYCGVQLSYYHRIMGQDAPNGWKAWQMDHIRPRANGGTNCYTNVVAACCYCNNAKSKMDWEEFLEVANLNDRCFAYCPTPAKKWLRCRNNIANIKFKYCHVHTKASPNH